MSLQLPPLWANCLICLLLSSLTQCLTSEEDLVFTSPVYNGSIAENSIGKTYVITSQRMGIPITDPSLTIRYKIVSGDDQKYFKAETRRIGDFCLLLIRTRTENFAVLNREYQDLYVLRVRASATSLRKKSVKLKAQTEVLVTVLDTNDLNPLFDPVHYDVSVDEDMPLYQSIIQVSAFDADIGINGEMYYSFLERSQIFAIHPSLGTITLTRHLNYQNQSSHTLIVVVEDRGPKFRAGDLKASSATVKINVIPVNIHAPEIIIRQLPNILEESDPDLYAIVTVEDKDKGIHGEIDYLKIVDGDPDNTFRVVKGSKKSDYTVIADHPLHLQGYSLVLQAADRGTPTKTSTSILHIRQSDNRNQMPIFDHSDYEVIIDEVAPVGTPLVIVKAFDPRGKAIDLIYNIETGNDGLTFAINSKTGLVSTAKPLDREAKAYYSLTVSAIDKNLRGMRKKGSTIINIQVLDCNDNDPLFNTSFLTIAFNENRPIGSLVFTARAVDIDEKDNGYVTYSIANINPVPFKIDHFNGEIKTTEILDFETMKRDYILKIRASDWGSPFRRQAEMILKIKLKDINDHRPSFEKVDCISYVSKHAFPGTEIFTFSAIDFDAGSVVLYKMVPSNDDSCFNLDSKTGILSVTCDLSHQHFKERILNVSATDGTHFAETMSIVIKIMSEEKGQRILERDSMVECKDAGVTARLKEQKRIGEANNRKYAEDEIAPVPSRYAENKYIPEFAPSLPNEISINESLPVGSVVTVLQAQDHDTSYNGKLIYVISGGNEDSCFKMDLYTGKLLVLSKLDRERKSRYILNITAFDLGQPQKFSFKSIIVNILDVNDNPPIFEKNSYFIEIPEDSPFSFSLLRLMATDEDAGRNAEVRFSILTDTEDFMVDPERGILSVKRDLDRERQEVYELTVQVTDMAATKPLSSTAVVTVKLTDVNDNSPHFERQPYWVKVREDLPMGTVLFILTATDPDVGSVHYSISGGAEGKFEIDSDMGTLRLVHALDFARKQLYNVTVTARDDGQPPRETQAAVLVEVEPVREAIRPAPRFSDVILEFEVPENAPVGTEVATINVSSSGPHLFFSIRDGDGIGLFSIDNQGTLRTRAELDRESRSVHWLTVWAWEKGPWPRAAHVMVAITVLDVNDNLPLTHEPLYRSRVPENSPAGTIVLKLDAFDLDDASQDLMTFRISAGDPQNFFSINKTTGLIKTTSRRLNRESKQEHVLDVVISDGGTPQLSSTTRVTVRVADVNDEDPAFRKTRYRCWVPAGRRGFVCQVVAIDLDEGPNGDLEYSILDLSMNSIFQIHPSTGVISTLRSLEEGKIYEFTVKATDRDPSEPRSGTTLVVVEVVGNNPSPKPPVIRPLEPHLVVSEGEKVGTLIEFVTAHDPDGDRLWFIMAGGNEGDVFVVDSENGAIILAKPLDWETRSVHNLTINVTDGTHTDSTQVSISVMDVNEHSPEFSRSVYTVEISENTRPGTEILKLESTDKDEDKRVYFEIFNSASLDSQSKFALHSTRGTLSVIQSLDHETTRRHVLTVSVSDSGTPSKRGLARVIIDVLDHNDHAPEFLASLFEGQVYETAAIGTAVTQVLCVDRDHGLNAKISYSIVSGNVGNAFLIDPDLGLLTVAQELNQRVMPEYFLIVRATDHGNPPLNNTVTVRIVVTIADNAPPRFEKNEYVKEMYENTRPGISILSVHAYSRSSVTYEIVAGNEDDIFVVNPSSGLISARRPVDYETAKMHVLAVSGTNLVNANSTTQVTIHVLDVNDNSPAFVQPRFSGVVSEAARPGTIVQAANASTLPLVVTATDPDSEFNAVLTYTIVTPNPAFSIDPTTGAISTSKSLDYEKEKFYDFSVQVTDRGSPKLSSSVLAQVHIDILDVNDSPPYFEKQIYASTVYLPSYRGVIVTTLRCFDPDSPQVNTIRYSIVSGNFGDKFSLDENTGVLTVKKPDNLRDKYELLVTCHDGLFETSVPVKIVVQKSQASGLKFSQERYEAQILENTTDIITVAIIMVLGTELNDHLEYKILNPMNMFEIGQTSGVIQSTGKVFDREINSKYTLVVEAVNTGYDSTKIGHVLVEVNILDINDNAPIFINLPYYSVVPIEAKKNHIVRKVHAIDLDSGSNSYIHYELVMGDGSTFHVDRQSGLITLLKPVSPLTSEHELVVAAVDSGVPPMRTLVSVPIRVINQDMPDFKRQYYNLTVPENLPLTSPVVTVTAESPHNRQLIYSLPAGNELEEFYVDFRADPSLGSGPCVLYLAKELDYETTTRYQLTLRATDAVTGSFADVLVNLNVEDVNDNPPRFSQHSYNATVSEGAAIGTTLLQVHATDLDVTLRQRITYYLSGNDSSPFYIEPTEGIIFVKQPLDYENQSLYRFMVKAVDGGDPSPLSATANVWVTVTDMNDHPPVFPQSTFHCAVGDSVPRGHFVTRVVASDLDPSDQPRLVYSIVAGNELQTFAIDSSTGILSISSVHHLSQKASYTLNVTVTDGVYSSHTAVHLEVRAGNLHAPRFTRTVYEITAREDVPPGTALVTVMATDQDRAGDFSRVSYHIPSQEASLVFSIDPDTGEMFTKTNLDREKKHLYEVPIVAVDGGGLLDYAAVRVTVADVNDHAPQFLVSEYRTSVAANNSAGTTVLKIEAYDEDEGKDAKLNYLLYETSNSSVVLDLFGISSNEGVIYLKKSLAPHFNKAFQFFVQVQDNGSPPQSTYVPVNVVILPSQIPIPHFELQSYEFFLSEKEPIGTRISVLSVSSPEPVKFSFMPPGKGSEAEKYMYKFSVDDKGQIFLMASLDREEKSRYVITVKAETKFTALVATTEVTINVMDENDNPPVFESNPYLVSIAENVAKGSTILKVLANDADAGDNGAVTYAMGPDAGEAANVFHLDTKLGWLTTMASLDREAQAYYNFTVIATDSGAIPRSSSTHIHISVKDYNDNPPYFKRNQYETAINEDALPGTVIVTLETLDLDEDLSDPVDFYIISGDFFDQFQIKGNGDVSVKKPLDREKISSYLLEVIGTDGTFIAKTNVYIDVLDANDNPPVCLKDRYTEVISESLSIQTYILTIAASDADERRNAQLWYTLSGDGAEDFIIDSTLGLVKTARPLDRETRPRYQLEATVTDRGSVDWSCSSYVDIYISDVNDNAPIFSQNVYAVSIPEDAPIGTLLTKVHATDVDLGTSRRVSYALQDTDHFEVDTNTGLVRLSRSLDRESRAVYNITVRATDHGSPTLTTAAFLEVTVLDVNDNPPEFVRARYSATVAESAPPGTEVIRVLAASRDIGPNADISYSIVAGDPRLHFAIHLKSGSITVSKMLDFEKISEYELMVRATDGGVPPLSSECTVNISLLDTNDNPPVFQQSRYKATVPEDIVVGAPVVQVLATDADSFSYRQLQYSIVKGNRFGQFAINLETGAITVASSLDREMVSSYQLEVQCSDSGDPPLTAITEVTIEVTDINDNPPIFSQTNYTAVVQEGKPVGFTVLKFTVIDADAAPNTTPFTFTFLSGNEKNAFRLVQQDATLRTATQFNPREHGEFVLHIQVMDNGQPPLRSAAWVTVLVIEESKHPPHVTPFTAHINSYLDDFPGGSLGRIHATDRDPYDKLAYELASSHHHLFSLNREDGTLAALPGLDVGHYNLTISVTDGKFTTYSNSLITVNLITEYDLSNAISIQFSDVTPEDFYLQYQKAFAKGIRNIFNVRIKDVNILSIQPTSPTGTPPSKNLTLQDSWNNSQDVDVLFVIHKGTQNYFPSKSLFKKIKEKQETIESNIGLKIVKMFESRCAEDSCVNGDCSDRLILDKSQVTSITTETLGFVTPQHYSKMECVCELGFGGSQCEVVVNECGHRPCETFQVCVPEPLSYHCQCPPGKTGPLCDQDKVPVCNDNTCYQEHNPLSFRGRSYVRYSPLASIDRHLSITLDLRTIQHTGNLLFVAGDHDYSILEMVNGVIQYRFECGGGEGVVRVEGKPVNDGKWHEVCVERKGRLAEVSVDRAYRSAGSAPGVHDISALNGSDIIFGAEVRHSDDVRRGFVGCMDNLRLGGQPLTIHASPASPTATLKRLANVEFQCQSLFEAGICGSQPCQNGGSCQPTAEEKSFTCQCLSRFTGPTCEIDTDPCASSPCLHGGRCRNLQNDFHCDCPSNLSGKRCDYGRYCNPNPCHNGGICKEGSHSAICKCNGFNGDLCQFDINECLGNPCANGASCINIQGSFHCQCPSNMTGTLCTEHLFTNSITSTSWNTTPEEIVGIIVVILFIFIIAVVLACCCRCRNKHRRAHRGSHNGDDLAASEFMLKNSMVDKEHVKRWSKISNLEVSSLTPPLPPRPTSYTPSTQEAINTLNKLDTVRSYGSATEDLENLSRYTSPAFLPNMNKASIPPSLSPPPPSDTESMIKGSWDQDLTKESMYQDKIQNTEPLGPSILNALSPNSRSHPSVQSLSSVDDLAGHLKMGTSKLDSSNPAGYHWDCSDWAAACPRLQANITEVANSEVVDSSSESNLSQVRTATTDDEVTAYGFPPQGGQGFRFALPDSLGTSCSDLSNNVICGIDDSDAEPDTSPQHKTNMFASSAVI